MRKSQGHNAWSYRNVCWRQYEEEVRSEMQRLEESSANLTDSVARSSGLDKNLKTFQPALTSIWNSLMMEQQDECRELAKKWNAEGPPKEDQRRY